MIEIKVRCKGSHELSLDELHILQDVDDKFILKELSKDNFEKLKALLEKKGFWFPFFFWYCKEDNLNYFIDGTQRDKILNWMRQFPLKYKLPTKYPCSEIFADSKQEAAEAILAQSSGFGKITDEGLDGFLHEYGLIDNFRSLKSDLNFWDIDLNQFEKGYLESYEQPINKNQNVESKIVKCPNCGYEIK